MAPNTWRAYRSDLADFATWVAYTSAEWRAPEVVATYLRTLEDGGAAYATISRRLTSIHKLVAIAAGDLDYEDPTKHPRVGVTLQAIRRRLSTDQDQANPLTSQRLPPGPVVDRHRHRRGDARRGGVVGWLVRGAAPLRAGRSANATTCHWTETASCCTSLDELDSEVVSEMTVMRCPLCACAHSRRDRRSVRHSPPPSDRTGDIVAKSYRQTPPPKSYHQHLVPFRKKTSTPLKKTV